MGDVFCENYFTQRITNELGITTEENSVELFFESMEGVESKGSFSIFSEDNRGNIRILVYTLDRHRVQYEVQKSSNTVNQAYRGDTTQDYYITRLHPDSVKDGNKYLIPKGAGTYPFFHPSLIDKYERAEEITTLVLTEGFFKAFKGAMHGFDIVGLSSITHYREKKTKSLHRDILSIIYRCKVKNVVMLYDGDCLNISTKDLAAGKDISKRPNGFLQSMLNISELLRDQQCTVWFAHVQSDCHENKPKGLDDLLCTFSGREDDIARSLKLLGTPSPYFYTLNMTLRGKRLQSYFSLSNVDQFFGQWGDLIGLREFIYHGTTYQVDSDGKVQMTMPREAKNFFRVGDDYYEMVDVPNIIGSHDSIPMRRNKGTITDDFGQKIIRSIPKYKAFCNVPDHLNYQQVINNCYNNYSRFTWEPEAGNCNFTLSFLAHIFEDQIELGLDYVQLLYQRPAQVLPIVCLVSKENSTGKTTFAKWLKEIFENNMVIVGNAELANEFNSYIATRLIVACDETFIEKRTVIEKIKSMSTANRIAMQGKGKDHVEVWHFAKYMLLSNNEDNFILAGDEDIRYWVRKVKRPAEDTPNLLQILRDEIPAFLAYLNERKLSTTEESRMWFAPSLLVTDALQRVREGSRSRVERLIFEWVRDQFIDFGVEVVKVTPTDIKQYTDIKDSTDTLKIGQILVDKLKATPSKIAMRYVIYRFYHNPALDEITSVADKKVGKAYTITRESVFSPSEIEDYWGNNPSTPKVTELSLPFESEE